MVKESGNALHYLMLEIPKYVGPGDDEGLQHFCLILINKRKEKKKAVTLHNLEFPEQWLGHMMCKDAN